MKRVFLEGPSAALALLAGAAAAGDVGALVVDAEKDVLLLLDPVDGKVLDPEHADLLRALPPAFTPIEAIAAGGELWVSDQIADVILRFSIDGERFLGSISSGRDNLRGLAYAAGVVYACNGGSSGGAPGNALKCYATDGTLLWTAPAASPFDVVEYGGALLVSNAAEDRIERYAFDGSFLGVFHAADASGGIGFPQQLAPRANGNLLAAGYEEPRGVYEYDPQGVQVAYWPNALGVRGVGELASGEILITDANGIYVLDPASGFKASIASGGDPRYVSFLPADLGASYCSSNPNSTGLPARIMAGGTTSVAANALYLVAENVPPTQNGIFFYGSNQAQIPFGNGFRCVTTGSVAFLARLPLTKASASARLLFRPDLDAPPTAVTRIDAGETWNFQAWFRDPAGGGAFFDLSDGLTLTFTP